MTEAKSAHWINKTHISGCGVTFIDIVCSKCGQSSGLDHTLANYCPNCGIRMGGEKVREIRFEVSDYADRRNVVFALANNGYNCRIEPKKAHYTNVTESYYVVVAVPDDCIEGVLGHGNKES